MSLQSPGCLRVGVISHEFMHALGFVHEQSRFDRDKYVTIMWQNIWKGNIEEQRRRVALGQEISTDDKFKNFYEYLLFFYVKMSIDLYFIQNSKNQNEYSFILTVKYFLMFNRSVEGF